MSQHDAQAHERVSQVCENPGHGEGIVYLVCSDRDDKPDPGESDRGAAPEHEGDHGYETRSAKTGGKDQNGDSEESADRGRSREINDPEGHPGCRLTLW